MGNHLSLIRKGAGNYLGNSPKDFQCDNFIKIDIIQHGELNRRLRYVNLSTRFGY